MHALPALKQACLEALDDSEGPPSPALFFSIVDPGSALELVEVAETRIADEEVRALHQVISELCECMQRMTSDPASIELTRCARMVVGAARR